MLVTLIILKIIKRCLGSLGEVKWIFFPPLFWLFSSQSGLQSLSTYFIPTCSLFLFTFCLFWGQSWQCSETRVTPGSVLTYNSLQAVGTICGGWDCTLVGCMQG